MRGLAGGTRKTREDRIKGGVVQRQRGGGGGTRESDPRNTPIKPKDTAGKNGIKVITEEDHESGQLKSTRRHGRFWGVGTTTGP